MFHGNTEQLLDYWRGLTEGGSPPSRTQVDPVAFGRLLPQVFMLGRIGPCQYRFRLAGELVVDLHADALRNADALQLWAPGDRLRLVSALETSRRRAEPVVVSAMACTRLGLEAPLEVLFAPLSDPRGEPDRVLGLYQPRALLSRLGGQAVDRLQIGRLTAAFVREGEPALRLASVDGRRIA
jgi:hypothetical protein